MKSGFDTPSSTAAVSSCDSTAVAQRNGKSAAPVDTVDQPRLRGVARSRFNLYRHLHRHGLQSADSVSSLESSEDSECPSLCIALSPTHTRAQIFIYR